MDFIIKAVSSFFKWIKAAIYILYSLYHEWSEVLARANRLSGYPLDNPTSSFWQDDPPYPDPVNIQRDPLFKVADVVIIGSGITGVAVARALLHERERQDADKPFVDGDPLDHDLSASSLVLVLEARDLCSGATGRNGGHIKASPHEMFHRLVHKRKMDPSRAAKLCEFQLGHVQTLINVAEAEGIDEISECREVSTTDLAIDEKVFETMKTQKAEFEPYAPPNFNIIQQEGKDLDHVNDHVVGAMKYQAGAMWPYRFVTALWKNLLYQFPEALSIQTGVRVEQVQVVDRAQDTFPYSLSTSRGRVKARHVVYATNAFTSQLVPGLQGKTTGVLCHMTAQRPGDKFPSDCDESYSVLYRQGFDYITQLRGGGELMIGGGLFRSGRQGMDMIGNYDDRKLDALTLMHLGGVLPTLFQPNWGCEEPEMGERMIKAWSGVVGFSPDVLPLVGRLDSRITKRTLKSYKVAKCNTVEPGEWISAYFCGEGMVWAWLCGTAVGIMLAGSEEEDLPEEPGRPGGRLADWFPKELYASWERVVKLDVSSLVDEL